MYFTFDCPECQKHLKVPSDAAGRKARCPYCKHSFTVPEGPEPEVPAEESRAFPGIDTRSVAGRVNRTPQKKRPAESRQKASSGGSSDRTDVNLILSGAIGLGLAAGFLLLMIPLKMAGIFIGELFLERGWVPIAEVFLFAWSVVILFLKWKKIKRQKDSMLFDLLPNELSEDITQESVGQFVDHARQLPLGPDESFLVSRVLRGLEHFRVRNSNPEVAEVLNSQSDIDANAVQSSYTILNVFIWAIPILGFVGTVIGISVAVSGIDMSGDIANVKVAQHRDQRTCHRLRYDVDRPGYEHVRHVPGQFAPEGRRGHAQLGRRVLQRESAQASQRRVRTRGRRAVKSVHRGTCGRRSMPPWLPTRPNSKPGAKLRRPRLQTDGPCGPGLRGHQQGNAQAAARERRTGQGYRRTDRDAAKNAHSIGTENEAVHQKAAGSMNQSAESLQTAACPGARRA